ncbi:MAG: DUF4058 family protein, partial [Anaerolineae bacterium]|nr:DUF4058 family protein [Anaerolineae bacterium]
MSPVSSLKNQYCGINAHLHSRLQNGGNWAGFHTAHIGDLARLLRVQLFPMGYTAEIEDSLQVRRSGDAVLAPRADVLILDEGTSVRPGQTMRRSSGDAQEMVMTLPEALGVIEEVDYYRAIAIYPTRPEQGEPVAWIELLSPSNKPRGQDWSEYRHKRERLLHGQLVFVEMDYLHESPPTLEVIRPYLAAAESSGQPEAFPYRIAVFDPRPVIYEGQARMRLFRVDDPVPVVNIPLLGEDVLTFDFGVVYDKTFTEMLYGHEVDYTQLPLSFDRYNSTDQARIVNRMLAVLAAAEQGADLEQRAPLP